MNRHVLLVFYLFVIPFTYLSAQLHIDNNENVGIGIDDAGTAKTLIENTNSNNSLKLKHTFQTGASVIGIENILDQNGNNIKTGILNDVQQNASNFGTTSGLKNQVQGGGGTTFGIHNEISESGAGYKCGIFNKVRQTANGSNVIGMDTYVYPNSTNPGVAYGYRAEIKPSANSSKIPYGVFVTIDDVGTLNHYGVYSTLNGHAGYAGWFDGNVQVNGVINFGSDQKLKENIKAMGRCAEILEQIKPRRYQLKSEVARGELGQEHFGFVAQELEAVLPNLVHSVEPPPISEDGVAAEPYKSVNYIELIPFLTQALKEQHVQINQQQKQINQLIKKVEELSK